MSLIKIDNPLFFRWAQYLVLSLPITIIFSRVLADLTIVILALFFLTFKKTNYFYKNKIIILATVFIIFCSISSILSNNPFVSLKSSFLHIRFILFILSLSLLFVYAPEDFLKKLFYIFLSCYLILFFDATFQFFFKFNIFGYVVSPINRVSSLFFDELVLGSYLVKLFPLIIFLYFYLNLKFKPIYLIYFIIHLYFIT